MSAPALALGVARFTRDGCGYNLDTREILPRGVNVIHQPCHWNVSREWAESMAAIHGVRLLWQGNEATP